MSQALAEKLAEAQFSDLNDYQALQVLLAPDAKLYGTTREHTNTGTARGILLAEGAWSGIVIAAEDQTLTGPGATDAQKQLRACCITVRDTLTLTSEIHTGTPATYPRIDGVLSVIVGNGLMSQATKDELMALCEKPNSWADINFPGLTERDVYKARKTGGI